MRFPADQQQQRVQNSITPQVASSLPVDASSLTDDTNIFGAALQLYNLTPSSPDLQVGPPPVPQSDGMLQWPFLNQQADAQEPNMEESFTQQMDPQQMLDQQHLEQFSSGQQIFDQQLYGQQLYNPGLLGQETFDQQDSALQNYGQLGYDQQVFEEGIFDQQTPAGIIPFQQNSVQQMYGQEMPVQQMNGQEMSGQQDYALQAPGTACMTSQLTPGLELCTNCHETFIASRNHGMACIRHRVDKPAVNPMAIEWTVWDDALGGPKDAPWVIKQFPHAFYWTCCQRLGGAPGCMSEAHVPKQEADYVMEAVMYAVNADEHAPLADGDFAAGAPT